ncbi:hypothetical protein GGD63_008103 [Bradyrhizobium sp. cir1]|nr:hypothetical protein [Bradyrhizobium sp. cir1]
MIEAARETLKALGLEGHEALLVGHNDEPHPHIHVIVNRVNPETGIAAPLKMDHLNSPRGRKRSSAGRGRSGASSAWRTMSAAATANS